MSSQTKPCNVTTANNSDEKSAFNLNRSIQRIRAKWNETTRERREQQAIAMQEQLASLLGANSFSLSAD